MMSKWDRQMEDGLLKVVLMDVVVTLRLHHFGVVLGVDVQEIAMEGIVPVFAEQ